MVKKIETIEVAGVGNTKTPACKKIQEIQYKSWCFTLNNYENLELIQIKKYFDEYCEKVICGFEVGENKTPHLQGFFSCIKKCRFSEFKKIDGLKRCHIEKCNNEKASEIYCQKDGKIFYKKGDIAKPLKCITDLKPWQLELDNVLKDEPNNREVYWIHEPVGNVGKSSYIKYHLIKKYYACGFCDGGKKSDIVHMIFNLKKDPEIVFFDLPRETEGNVSYSAIEVLKNGMIFNVKFETGFKVFNSPHVIIFSNYFPNCKKKLSKDRWKIFEIVNDKLVPQNNVATPPNEWAPILL